MRRAGTGDNMFDLTIYYGGVGQIKALWDCATSVFQASYRYMEIARALGDRGILSVSSDS
jgi:hypothetical protein